MFVVQAYIVATVLATCCLASGVKNRADVARMQVSGGPEGTLARKPEMNETYNEELIKLVLARLNTAPGSRNPTVSSFDWKNCGGSSDLLVVNSVALTPDPLKVPGTVGLTFDVTVQETFDTPLKLAIELKKHESFFWLPIPCIDDMGSCTYNDVCQKLAGLTCPKPFVDKNIPCKCPFTKGRYSLPITTFDLNKDVPSGYYFVQAELTHGSVAVNCIQMHFNIS